MNRPILLCVMCMTVGMSCRDTPSRDEARAAILSVSPLADSGTKIERVWSDGPPWFSCAEIFAKSQTALDSTAVRDQVGNWRGLLIADWVIFRDTTSGVVTDPGWCIATPRVKAAVASRGWKPVAGPITPTGTRRRGWDVPAGQRRLILNEKPIRVAPDSARATYVLGIAANENGVAIGANRDSVTRQALLVRRDGKWRVAQLNWSGK